MAVAARTAGLLGGGLLVAVALQGCGGAAPHAITTVSETPTLTLVGASAHFHDEAGAHGMAGGDKSFAVAFADVDSDGDVDMYVTNSGSPNHLFINSDGKGSFVDATAASGLGLPGASRGVAFADVNGDGHLDVYVSAWSGSNALLLGDGAAHFTDTTAAAGVGDVGHGQGVCFADVDRDGDVDLFVANFGNANRFYVNDGTGIFTDGTSSAGLAASGLKTFGCVFGDVDEDGDLDLYVTNDGGPNHLYLNDGSGVFTDGGQGAINGAGRGVQMADFNGDGHLDLMMVAADVGSNLLLGDGQGGFTDVTDAAGVRGLGATAQGVNAADLDADGDIDIVVTYLKRAHAVYENDGKGHFRDISGQAGMPGNMFGQGVAFADVNGDGALDAYVTSYGAYPWLCTWCSAANKLLINEVAATAWLKVRPLGAQGRPSLVGVEVRVFHANTTTLAGAPATIDGGSGFASQNGNEAYIGLGAAGKTSSFDVHVRCGSTSEWLTKASQPILGGVARNQIVEVSCSERRSAATAFV